MKKHQDNTRNQRSEESQTHLAYIELERRIVSLDLEPGSVVTENSLSAELGVGRTPVREALRELSREALVHIMPKRGIMIAEIDIAKQLKLVELRRPVDRLIAELAAMRANEQERSRFAQLADEMREAETKVDGQGFLTLDSQFNTLMVKAARNEFATAAARLTQGLSRRFWFAYYRHYNNLAETIHLHANIARKVSVGDVEGSSIGAERLIDNVEAFTRETLDFERSWVSIDTSRYG